MKEEKGWNLCLVASATGHVFKSGTDHGHKPYPKKRKKMKTLSNHISLAKFFRLFYTNNLLFLFYKTTFTKLHISISIIHSNLFK